MSESELIEQTEKTFEDIKHIDENGNEYWYFAVKTRQQEITEEKYKQLTEDEKRLYNRKIVKDRNKYLFDTARKSGVKNNKVDTENEACFTHNRVGKAVRETIKKLGGTMPEDLPTPEKSIKQLEKENQNHFKLKK